MDEDDTKMTNAIENTNKAGDGEKKAGQNDD